MAMEFFKKLFLKVLRSSFFFNEKSVNRTYWLSELVYHDDLTGLFNTRYLTHVLDREVKKAKRTNETFGVLFIDVDHFKRINDRFGHLMGSKLLGEMGEVIRTNVREHDIVFRYGGDEFIAILSGCNLETAKGVGERVREAVERHLFLSDTKCQASCTVSIGVAIFPDDVEHRDGVLEAADQAMYASKRLSRNRVTIASHQ